MADSEKEEIIKEVFDLLDKDSSNSISLNEIDEVLKKMTDHSSFKHIASRIKAQFNLIQSDLSFEDFRSWILKEFNIAFIKDLSKHLRHHIKPPIFAVIQILEELKTRVLEQDQEKLDWCISQLTRNDPFSYNPGKIQMRKSFLDKEIIDMIEQHSPLPRQKLQENDERLSHENIQRRMTALTPTSPELLEINLPNSTFDLNDFNLPIFDLAEEFGSNTLLNIYAFKAFTQWDLFNSLFIDVQTFLRFVTRVGEGYKDNPYHNVLHAADVMQACHVFLVSSGLYELSQMNQTHAASLLLGAIIHDYKHPGLNNNYLMISDHKLALRYNDQSILENFHVSKAFKLVQDETLNIFKNLSKEEYRTIRKLIIATVLATDMSKHAVHVGEVQTKLYKSKNLENEKEFILSCFMHLADLSNPCRVYGISENWALKVSEEFFRQGDKERIRGIEISPLCDRSSLNIAKSQIGFISGVIIPFITPICREINGLRFLQKNAKENRDKWAERIEEFEGKVKEIRLIG